jgi:hypothetical protein
MKDVTILPWPPLSCALREARAAQPAQSAAQLRAARAQCAYTQWNTMTTKNDPNKRPRTIGTLTLSHLTQELPT